MAINWECDVFWSNGQRTVGHGDTESEARQQLDERVLKEPFNNGTATVTRTAQCRFIGVVDGVVDGDGDRVVDGDGNSRLLPSPIKDKNNAYYIKRIGEHSEWYLKHSGHAHWWDQIELSARNDAANTSSAYYQLRLAEHTEWLLNNSSRTDWWNQIELSARRDANI
jgi:hypothetical protein